MKIEFLEDIDDGGAFPDADPKELLRLYDFNVREVYLFRESIRKLSNGSINRVEMSQLAFATIVNCNLSFVLDHLGEGVELPLDKKNFECRLGTEDYDRMIQIINSVINSANEVSGYNWLYDPPPGKVDILFSTDGSW